MADPLVTVSYVETLLGRALTPAEDARMGLLIDAASARFRREAGGQLITAGTSTHRVPVGRVCQLRAAAFPQLPVTAVTGVATTTGTAISFLWDGLVLQYTAPYGYPTNASGFSATGVDITYDHGYDPGPDDVQGAVANMALRAFGTAPEDGALTGETITNYSYQRGSTGAAGPVGMLPEETRVARAYRRPAGTVWALPA